MTGTTSAADVMPCMEVWGGNQAEDRGVIMSGLDAWLYCRPFEGGAGGGDVHLVSSCATGRVTRLLVADVSGHGDAVSETGRQLRRLMRRYVNHLDQTRLLTGLNREFRALADEGRFATSVVATFFAPTNGLVVCNAGHPPPLLYRTRRRRWAALEQPVGDAAAANIPLGVLDDSVYEEHTLRLDVGDLLLFYTDSLPESRGGDGRALGTDGLLQILRHLEPGRPEALIEGLIGRVAALAEGNLRDDDVTVLLIRPNGLAPRVPLRDRLKAPARVVTGIVRSLRRGGDPAPFPQISLPNIGGAIFGPLNALWPRGRRESARPARKRG